MSTDGCYQSIQFFNGVFFLLMLQSGTTKGAKAGGINSIKLDICWTAQIASGLASSTRFDRSPSPAYDHPIPPTSDFFSCRNYQYQDEVSNGIIGHRHLLPCWPSDDQCWFRATMRNGTDGTIIQPGVVEDDSGLVAGIAIAVISIVVLAFLTVAYMVYRHHVHRNSTSMNFDNPVYRKTTEDQFSLEKNLPSSRMYPSTVGEEAQEPLNKPSTNDFV